MRVTAVFAVSLAIAFVSAQKSCNLKELDLCVSAYLFQQKALPTSDREMNAQCDQLDTLQYCVGNYTKRCFSHLQRELIGWLFSGQPTPDTNFCSTRGSSPARDKFYAMSPCMNSIGRERDKCVAAVRRPIEHLFEVKYDQKIAGMCCVFGSAETCMTTVIEQKCGADYVHFFKYQYLGPNVYDFVTAVCKGYESGSAKCARLMPTADWQSDKNSKKSALTRVMSLYL